MGLWLFSSFSLQITMDLEVQNAKKEDQELLKELAAGRLSSGSEKIQFKGSRAAENLYDIHVSASSYVHIRILVVRIRIIIVL